MPSWEGVVAAEAVPSTCTEGQQSGGCCLPWGSRQAGGEGPVGAAWLTGLGFPESSFSWSTWALATALPS